MSGMGTCMGTLDRSGLVFASSSEANVHVLDNPVFPAFADNSILLSLQQQARTCGRSTAVFPTKRCPSTNVFPWCFQSLRIMRHIVFFSRDKTSHHIVRGSTNSCRLCAPPVRRPAPSRHVLRASDETFGPFRSLGRNPWAAYPATQATNDTDYLLLASEDVSVFFDNSFVTKTGLATVSPGESFQAFLGTDPAVKVCVCVRVDNLVLGRDVYERLGAGDGRGLQRLGVCIISYHHIITSSHHHIII